MWTISYCFAVIYITQVTLYPQETIYSNNGWIPITNYQVHRNQLPRDIIYYNNKNTETNHFVVESSTERKVEEEILLDNHEFGGIDERCKDSNTCNINVSDDLHLELQNSFLPNIFMLEEHKNNTLRRSKKIIHDSFQSNNDEKHTKEVEINEKSYEVTEGNTFEDVEQKHETEKGYTYNQPNNYTTNFFKLLLKYGITSTDTLPNYSLSLRHKAHNLEKHHFSLKPEKYQIPFRYNSLNHMPVDPLLAVFLSNYGYYLQGQYGIRNNYNNLYGYLASNNLHNNKPFGLYKIFADTDSSH